MTLPAPKDGWWRRNRLWLLLLAPLAALATASASWAWVTVYLPQQQNDPRVAQGGRLHLLQDVEIDSARWHLDTRMAVTSVARVTTSGGLTAPKGGTLWEVGMRWSAAPSMPLLGCSIAVHDDRGHVIEPEVGALGRYSTGYEPRGSCTPRDAPGPVFDIGSSTPSVHGAPRPSTWTTTMAFVLPQGASPTELRIWWAPPVYASFPLPAR